MRNPIYENHFGNLPSGFHYFKKAGFPQAVKKKDSKIGDE